MNKTFLLLLTTYACSIFANSISASTFDYTVGELHQLNAKQYAEKLLEAQNKSGMPKPDLSSDQLSFKYLEDKWLNTHLVHWSKYQLGVRLQISDFYTQKQFPSISPEEQKERSLAIYLCMNVLAKSTKVFMDAAAINIPVKGNTVHDGIGLCFVSMYETP